MSWLSNAQRVKRGLALTPRARRGLLTMYRNGVREYRQGYGELMRRDIYRNPAYLGDTERERLKVRLVGQEEKLDRLSPERIRQMAEGIELEEFREAVKSGRYEIESALEKRYIQDLEKKISGGEEALAELGEDIKEERRVINGWQERELLELTEEMEGLSAEGISLTKELREKLARGEKASKYLQERIKVNRESFYGVQERWEGRRRLG
jgi:uncharacterized coiled-coil protein SlyX